MRFTTTQSFSEQIGIPDRQDEVYASALDIQLFSPGQQISSGRDIAQICVTIEHSFLADLDMWIECPDGSRVTLLDKDEALGFPVNNRLGYGEVDDTGAEPAETYCWTADAAQTVYEYIRTQTTTGTTRPILPFDRSYLPIDLDFDALIGCEMNGEWRLNVVDNFVEDDGTVYSWEITFADELVPDNEDFTVPVEDNFWTDSGIYSFYSPDSVVYTAGNPGYSMHELTVVDSFGCSYDTLIRVDIGSPLESGCLTCTNQPVVPARDTQVCAGQSFRVDFSDAFALDTLIRWEALEHRQLSGEDTSMLVVSGQYPGTFGPAVGNLLSSVCIDLSADLPLAGIEVRLQSPDGALITLVPRGSVTGTRITECFLPESGGDWEILDGQRVNGQWALIVDDADDRLRGELTSWSLDLAYRPDLTYTWTTGSGELSCTDCPDPTITTTTGGSYELTATTALGCTQSLTYTIDLLSADVAYETTINDGCAGEEDGSITLRPLTNTQVNTYTWSNGAATRDISGLSAGTYSLTVVTDNGCEKVFSYVINPPEPLAISIDTVIGVSCFGESDGGIMISANGGYGGYTYDWSGDVNSTLPSADKLRAGNYGLTVTDAAGCTVSTEVAVISPALLSLELTTQDVRCRGGSDGEIRPVLDGGTPPYRYRWNDNSTAATLTGVPIGSYSLTITDANGCSVTNEVSVEQPEIPLSARVVSEVAGCYGTQGNEATVLARGGNGDYRYAWSNGETGTTAFALPAGANTVQVTDRSGCTYDYSFQTESRPKIEPAVSLAAGDECRDIGERTLRAQADGIYFDYRWSTGANGSRISDLQPETVYTVTMTDAEGCSGTASFTTDSGNQLELDLETTPVDCFGDRNGALEILSASNRHGTDFNYQWGANTGFAEGPSIRNRPAGDYNLTLVDAIGCRYDTLLKVPGPPIMKLQETVTPITCFGNTDGQISVNPTGGNGGYTYQWAAGGTNAKIEHLAPGNYDLTVSDAKGCKEAVSYALTNPEEISLDLSIQGPVCGGEYNGRIDVSAAGGQSPLQFSLDNQRYSKASTFNGLGGGAYTVYVKDQVGCTISEEVDIEDGPSFSVDLGKDRQIIFGDSILLFANVRGGRGDLDYAWSGSYPATLSCTECPSPIAKPDYEIDYRLSLIDALGCVAEDMVRVRVRKIREIAVPTGFTPNNDGYNDRLLVHGRPGTRVKEFSVFDRWGGWLFAARDFTVNDEDSGWDGRDKRGKALDSGVYIFKVEVEYEDGSSETLSGQTTLIR